MPPPSGPEIVVQCYWGDATRVADAIAAGADLLQVTEPACPACSPEKYGIPDPRHGIALHWACNYAHVDCVRALLATGCSEQLDWARATSGATPLILLCQNAGRAAFRGRRPGREQGTMDVLAALGGGAATMRGSVMLISYVCLSVKALRRNVA